MSDGNQQEHPIPQPGATEGMHWEGISQSSEAHPLPLQEWWTLNYNDSL